jgi:hypothetical protein
VQHARVRLSAELELDLARRAFIADRNAAVMATASVRALNVQIALTALTALILAVSLVLLPGAVWMHAT